MTEQVLDGVTIGAAVASFLKSGDLWDFHPAALVNIPANILMDAFAVRQMVFEWNAASPNWFVVAASLALIAIDFKLFTSGPISISFMGQNVRGDTARTHTAGAFLEGLREARAQSDTSRETD